MFEEDRKPPGFQEPHSCHWQHLQLQAGHTSAHSRRPLLACLQRSPPGPSDAGPKVLSSADQRAEAVSAAASTRNGPAHSSLKTRSESGALCQLQLVGWGGGRGGGKPCKSALRASKKFDFCAVPTCAADIAAGVTLKIK